MKDAVVSTFFDLELKQRVTGRKIDVVALARVPATYDQSTRIWIRFDLVNQPRYLIDSVVVRVMTAERAPEISVNRAEVAGFAAKATRVLFISPFLPNIHAARAQVRFVRVAGEQPEQLFRNH